MGSLNGFAGFRVPTLSALARFHRAFSLLLERRSNISPPPLPPGQALSLIPLTDIPAFLAPLGAFPPFSSLSPGFRGLAYKQIIRVRVCVCVYVYVCKPHALLISEKAGAMRFERGHPMA